MTNETKSFDDLSYADKLKELRAFEERWGSCGRLAKSDGRFDGVVRGGIFDGWSVWEVYRLRRTLEKQN